MHSPTILARQSQRLLQLGIVLILYLSIEGFAIPHMGSQRIGLSAHTLASIQGALLLALGLLWPRLRLSLVASRIAFWCLVYSALAILAAYSVAAALGVGDETIRLAGELPHGLEHGTAAQELLIASLAYSSAPTGVVSFIFILYGLRLGPPLS